MKIGRFLLYFSIILTLAACGAGGETAVSSQHSEDDALTGSLFYILQEPRRQALMRYDFADENSKLLFEVPTNAWLSHMSASPDGSQVALTYAPSPGENEIQYGYSSLYLLLADGRSVPRLLIEREAEKELFFNPTWSPDGKQIVYSHVTPLDEETFTFLTTLEKLDLATGERHILAENGIWPRFSPDGRFLTYIDIDAETLAAELVLSDVDGQNRTILIPHGQFVTLDSPFFSVDGKSVYFSAVTEQTSVQSWGEYLLGIKVASAHTLPGLWWRISVDGGVPEQVTSEAQVGQYGSVSPNGRFLAFSSQSGLFIIQPDGSGQKQLLDLSAADSLSWTR